LTINGNNFRSYSIVDFNGSSVVPSFVNSHQLVATIPAADIADPGTLQVLVQNPPQGGTPSNPIDGTSTTTTTSTCGGSDSNAISFPVTP
jgi:FlaG/FlaF family flagellin (archaellin)